MQIVKISELIGKYCMTDTDGQSLYELIEPQLTAGNSVELDFEGVKVFASPFFNFAIGQLLKDFSSEQLNTHVKFTGLSSTGRSVRNRVIANAKRYYSDSNYQRAVDSVMEEEALAL